MEELEKIEIARNGQWSLNKAKKEPPAPRFDEEDMRLLNLAGPRFKRDVLNATKSNRRSTDLAKPVEVHPPIKESIDKKPDERHMLNDKGEPLEIPKYAQEVNGSNIGVKTNVRKAPPKVGTAEGNQILTPEEREKSRIAEELISNSDDKLNAIRENNKPILQNKKYDEVVNDESNPADVNFKSNNKRSADSINSRAARKDLAVKEQIKAQEKQKAEQRGIDDRLDNSEHVGKIRNLNDEDYKAYRNQKVAQNKEDLEYGKKMDDKRKLLYKPLEEKADTEIEAEAQKIYESVMPYFKRANIDPGNFRQQISDHIKKKKEKRAKSRSMQEDVPVQTQSKEVEPIEPVQPAVVESKKAQPAQPINNKQKEIDDEEAKINSKYKNDAQRYLDPEGFRKPTQQELDSEKKDKEKQELERQERAALREKNKVNFKDYKQDPSEPKSDHKKLDISPDNKVNTAMSIKDANKEKKSNLVDLLQQVREQLKNPSKQPNEEEQKANIELPSAEKQIATKNTEKASTNTLLKQALTAIAKARDNGHESLSQEERQIVKKAHEMGLLSGHMTKK